MGSGIAQLCALLGHQVTLFDVLENALKKGLQDIEFSLKKKKDKSTLTETAANVFFCLKRPPLLCQEEYITTCCYGLGSAVGFRTKDDEKAARGMLCSRIEGVDEGFFRGKGQTSPALSNG